MRITLKQIEIFTMIAQTENMSQAANALHLTQSACSMALSTLENQLGGLLFDRQGKKLLLNERGHILFTKAVNLLAEINELPALVANKKKNNPSGQLIIGASTTIGNYLLPPIIGHYLSTFPNVNVTLRINNTEHIIQQLLKFNIDVGLIEGSCNADELDILPWKKDELIIIASPTHAFNQKKKLIRQDLNHAPWILREPGSGTREQFEKAMGEKINPFLELGHAEAIKQAVQIGLGISCLSKTIVTESIKKGLLVELKTPFLKLRRDFFILLHKQKYKTAALTAFLNQCKKDK